MMEIERHKTKAILHKYFKMTKNSLPIAMFYTYGMNFFLPLFRSLPISREDITPSIQHEYYTFPESGEKSNNFRC